MSRHRLKTADSKLGDDTVTRCDSRTVTMFFLMAVCLSLVFGLVALAYGEGRMVPQEMRAQRFVLVDDLGKERAELGIRANGEPRLTLWNQQRTVSASLGMDDAGRPHIALSTDNGIDTADEIWQEKTA